MNTLRAFAPPVDLDAYHRKLAPLCVKQPTVTSVCKVGRWRAASELYLTALFEAAGLVRFRSEDAETVLALSRLELVRRIGANVLLTERGALKFAPVMPVRRPPTARDGHCCWPSAGAPRGERCRSW